MMNNQNSNGEIQIVYVGTYTNGESEGIYVCQLDMSTGELKQVSVARNIENPSYLAVDAERNRLYAVNELLAFAGHSGGGVSAFAIQPSSGELTFINRVPSHGGAPCYLSISQNGRYLLIANYAGGNISVIPVNKEGVLGKPTEIVNHLGSSLHPKRQAGPHPHAIILDSANDYAFVPDLGLDKVLQYRFDHANGRLNANQRPWVSTKPGAGPRHMVFHENNQSAYVINELDSTINALAYDQSRGELKVYQTISTIPSSYAGKNSAADLHLAPNGKFLYGSNRGHDSIAIFAIDPETGELTLVKHTPTQGRNPRGFAIDPTGTFLLAANQDSDNILVFRIDQEHGTLTPSGHGLHLPSPVCLKVTPFGG